MTWEISGTAGRSLEVATTGPDAELLRSFMLDLRKLLADKSPSYFPSVMNAARRTYPDEGSAEWWPWCQAEWKHTLDNSPFGIAMNGQEYTPRILLDVWMNGELFHDDREKQQVWSDFERTGVEFHRVAVNHAIVRLVQVAGFALARLNYLAGEVEPVFVPGRSAVSPVDGSTSGEAWHPTP